MIHRLLMDSNNMYLFYVCPFQMQGIACMYMYGVCTYLHTDNSVHQKFNNIIIIV